MEEPEDLEMPPKGRLEITLTELAQVALGGQDLTTVHIALLHSLINILLKKFNCQNEKISIGGYESREIKEQLQKSKITPMAINDENIEQLQTKFNKIVDLNERIENIDAKLELHFKDIRYCNHADDHTFNWEKWLRYLDPCEDMCTLHEPENEAACQLVKNSDFIKKLLRRIASPLVKRIMDLENRIGVLETEFEGFLERVEIFYKKIQIIDNIILDLENLSDRVGNDRRKFINTMEEVQDMLDCKLDKIHMPALKIYLKTRFDEIESDMTKLKAKLGCPRATAVVVENRKCLSCDQYYDILEPHSCVRDKEQEKQKAAETPKKKLYCGDKNCKQKCKQLDEQPNLMERIAKIETDKLEVNTERRSCKLTTNFFQTVLGSDGNVYRINK